MDISYIINELGEDRENYFNAVAPPIMQTSNFAFASMADMRAAFQDEFSTLIYSRGRNPTTDILRKKLAALEGAEDCLVVNSGAAAIYLAVMSHVRAGDHIISVRQPYSWAEKLFTKILPKFNVTVTFIDGRDSESFRAATQTNTTIIYLESPNSWDLSLQDLAAVASIAREHGITTICDNSYSTGIFQQPIAMGIDVTVQSATKYIGGHSDTIGGVLCASAKIIERIFNSEFNTIGSGMQPFNAWLMLRGLRTLPARLERLQRTALAICDFLHREPLVQQVIFPGDAAFPQKQLAEKQMQGAAGLISFVLIKVSEQAIEKFCAALKHILLAVSWGGYESLIIPRCAGLKAGEYNSSVADHRMIRLYAGMEEPAYIIEDLQRGFAAMRE